MGGHGGTKPLSGVRPPVSGGRHSNVSNFVDHACGCSPGRIYYLSGAVEATSDVVGGCNGGLGSLQEDVGIPLQIVVESATVLN